MIRSQEHIRPGEHIAVFRHSASVPVREHTHEFIEIVYTVAGKGTHFIDGVAHAVQRGDLLFINIGQAHAVEPMGVMELVNCLITPQLIDEELIHCDNALELMALSSFADFERSMDKLVPMVSFQGKGLLDVEALIGAMFDEFYAKGTNYKTALKGLMLVFLTRIFRQMQASGPGDLLHQVDRLTPDLLRYIEQNCCQKITLAQLAQACFYNPSYFSRMFKECYGRSPMELIHEKRMKEALRLLEQTDLSVEAISLQVGYGDRTQFYRLFKNTFGMTPKSMRNARRA